MTKNLKLATMICLTALFFTCAIVFSAVAAEDINVTTNLENSYAYGITLTVPHGDITVNGETKKVRPDIVAPSGRAFNSETVLLDEAGQYSAVYKTEIGGENIRYISYFDVYRPIGESTGKNDAAVYYGNINGAEIAGDGLVVELTEGSVFRYNNVLNLKGKKITDSVINLNVVPSSQGTADFITLFITLTDVYDPSNTVTVRVRQTPEELNREKVSYVTAGFGKEKLYGYSWGKYSSASANAIYDSTMNYGFTANSSFAGYGYELDDYGIGISINEKSGDVAYLYQYNPGDNVIINLKNDKCFSTPWQGFTTGEVYLSVQAAEYNRGKARFIIKNILDEDLSEQFAKEPEALPIEIDTGIYSEEIVPGAIVGSPYAVFPATARGEAEVKIKAFYGVNSENRVEYAIENGYFTPDRAGIYLLEYSCENEFGTRSVKRVCVTAYEEKKLQSLEINVSGKTLSGIAGIRTSVVATVKTDGDDRLGAITVKKFAKHVLSSEIIEIDGDSFIPERTGEWKIIYVASDYAGRKSVSELAMTVTAPENLILDLSNGEINKFYLSGEKYDLPRVTAVHYDEEGKSGVACDVLVKFNGESEVSSSTTFIPESGYLNFIFRADGKEYVTENIPIIDSGIEKGKLKPQNFFHIESGEFTSKIISSGSYRNLTFGTESGGYMTFANAVKAQNLFFKFNINELAEGKGADADKVSIYFTDSADDEKTVKVSIVNDGGTAKYQVNDGAVLSLLYNGAPRAFSGSGAAMAYTVELADGAVAICSVNTRNFNYYYDRHNGGNGSVFAGFPSGKIYVGIEIEIGEKAFGTALNLVQLNTHMLYVTTDRVSPEFVNYGDEIGGGYDNGATVNFGKVYAMDVFSPNTEISVSITDESGTYVRNTAGAEVKNVDGGETFSVKFERIGTFTVTYRFSDSFGNSDEKIFYITIRDSVAPQISFDRNNVTVKAGKEHKFLVPQYSDDNAKNMTVSYYVESPDGILHEAPQGKFLFENKGVYLVHATVSDGRFTALSTYTVVAE